jgi:hypothetical protein
MPRYPEIEVPLRLPGDDGFALIRRTAFALIEAGAPHGDVVDFMLAATRGGSVAAMSAVLAWVRVRERV